MVIQISPQEKVPGKSKAWDPGQKIHTVDLENTGPRPPEYEYLQGKKGLLDY